MPRKIWLSTIAFLKSGSPASIEANVERAERLLEQGCAVRPDIVCLPETFAYVGLTLRAEDKAEPVPGPITDMAARMARRYETYLICPLLQKREGKVYNVAVLLDRRGRVQCIYEKVRPVTSTSDYTELERGVMPGQAPQVFDTDFGRIGILICFDITFPEEWARVKEMGAEIVFWPSAYNGGFPLQVYAAHHRYYVVSAVQSERAKIIDITGQVLAETDHFSPVISRQIDLEKRLYHLDFNGIQIPAIRAKHGRDVSVVSRRDDALMTVESHREDLTVADIEAEFGLEPLDAYRERNRSLHEALRQGKSPQPQVTPYLGRQMHL